MVSFSDKSSNISPPVSNGVINIIINPPLRRRDIVAYKISNGGGSSNIAHPKVAPSNSDTSCSYDIKSHTHSPAIYSLSNCLPFLRPSYLPTGHHFFISVCIAPISSRFLGVEIILALLGYGKFWNIGWLR